MTAYTLAESTGVFHVTGKPWGTPASVAELLTLGQTGGDNNGYFTTWGYGRSLSDTLHNSSILSVDFATVQLITEIVHLHITTFAPSKYGIAAHDQFKIKALLASANAVKLMEHLTLAQAHIVAQGLIMGDMLGLRSRHTPVLHYGLLISQLMSLTAIARHVLGAKVADGIDFFPLISLMYKGTIVHADALQLAGTVSPLLNLVVLEDDTIDLEDVLPVRAIYGALLNDRFGFEHSFVLPNGGVTSWALNTRTGALTEYLNFDFNSLARQGNSGINYLGASSSGLYRLSGTDDDGTPIVAKIKGGLFQFNGSHLGSIAAAYLGIRGFGQFYLKIETGNGRKYVYSLNATPMKTVRVELGKGLRSRYYSYELTSVGQDFDLDSIEFLPIEGVRRIGI